MKRRFPTRGRKTPGNDPQQMVDSFCDFARRKWIIFRTIFEGNSDAYAFVIAKAEHSTEPRWKLVPNAISSKSKTVVG